MRITVFGKGNVGGGLADLWERAGRIRFQRRVRKVPDGRPDRDAGYDPVHTGPLANAARQEAIIAIGEGMGEYVYRFAPVERL